MTELLHLNRTALRFSVSGFLNSTGSEDDWIIYEPADERAVFQGIAFHQSFSGSFTLLRHCDSTSITIGYYIKEIVTIRLADVILQKISHVQPK